MLDLSTYLSGVGSTDLLFLVLGEVLIFILIAMDLRLLKPRRFTALTWVGPVFALYVMASIFLGIALAVSAFSVEGLASDASFVLAAIVGALLGTVLGRHIVVARNPEGKTIFTGGKALVGLLLVLILPRALDELLILLGPWVTSYDLPQLLGELTPFDDLNILTGVLFVIGAFVGIGWRVQVRARVTALNAGGAAAKAR